jgi:hypothetical protein
MPAWFIRADPPAPCDVIVVAGSNPAGSTEAEAFRLWQQGLGRMLLCVGRPVAWHVAGDEIMARHVRALGVPADRVLAVDIPFSEAPDAGTMREEARLLLPFLRRQRFLSALVISSELQSRRRAFLLRPWRHAGIRVILHPIPDPAFHAAGWWRRKRDTKSMIGEMLGWMTLPFGG